jgi:8-oxo-dGTP pyrophosphatase MutT (NUDIX family)
VSGLAPPPLLLGAQARSLEKHLRFHRPADEREAAYLERMKCLLAAPGDPFSRDHFTPGHFTASSFVLSPDRGNVLLIFHSKLQLWLQPGGHFEPSDSGVPEAARREVAEETGVEQMALGLPEGGLLDVDIHRIPAHPRRGEPAHEHFDVRFLFVAPSLEFVAGSDAQAARWVALEDVEDSGTDDSVRRAIRKLLAAC